jgi:hypothetical protein
MWKSIQHLGEWWTARSDGAGELPLSSNTKVKARTQWRSGNYRARKKKFIICFLFFLNNLSHFIHFQLQINVPYALKLHLK